MRSFKACTIISILLFASTSRTAYCQEGESPFVKYLNHPWVDSVFNSLTPGERVAQLIWVAAYPNRDIGHEVYLSNLITDTHIGGMIFSQGQREKQTEMINYFQSISRVPLLIAEDGEWGIGMRLEGVVSFPYQLTLGAIRDDSLIYKMGNAVAVQFKRASVQINLAPVADVNNNPLDPEINYRSFGEDPVNTGRKSTMYMKGMQDYGVIAGMEGIDILDNVENPVNTIKSISEEIRKDKLRQQEIDEKCRKVLAAKYWAGLNHRNPVPVENINDDLSSPSINALIRELYAGTLTLLKNEYNLVPLMELQDKKILTIAINKTGPTKFQERISYYIPSDNISVDPSDKEAVDTVLKMMSGYNLVIAGIYGLDQRPQPGFGITPEMISFIDRLTENNKCIITWFGNPYGIGQIYSLINADALLLAYQENEFTEDLSAQLIFGGIGADGILPVRINTEWPAGFSIRTTGNIRMSYGLPENAGICSGKMERNIDSIVNIGLTNKAFPGCEVMIARKGMVIFHKTYGYQTYDARISVRKDDLFDLASVTKVSSTLAGLMLLDSEGKFSTEQKLGYYMPYFKGSNKENLLMKDILTHQAGLISWIPFWRETVKKDTVYKKKVYNHEFSEKYPLKVAEGLYINKNYRSKIFNEIKKSPLGEKKYVYSDLAFIISTGIIDNLTGEKWYDFVTHNIYHKLGAFEIGFNPYKKYSLSRIVPTEYDSLFRKQQLHGTVHDEGAAMLGGISGHAGLFATANDLMKLMELYRRMGNYGGEQLISEEVLRRYTQYQFPENNNRRGLGFDKPFVNNAELVQKDSYPTRSASPESFGHSGFTGTFVWMDPVYEISYVFLSNRVYPTRNNNKLSELNIRTDILQAIYDSIKK